MRKKFYALILTSALAISMMACGGNSGAGTTSDVPSESDSEAHLVEELATISTTEASTEATTEEYGTGNMIKGGDFSDGLGEWVSYVNGGACELLVNDQGEMQVDIEKIGSVEHGVQIYYDGFSLRKGGIYNISFDIHSTLERPLEWRCQLNGGDYHAYAKGVISPNSEVMHISQEFSMEEDTDPAPRLCFNMGLVADLKDQGITELPPHSIMIDNVELVVVDATNMIKDPEPVKAPLVKVNQVGYTPEATKTAIFSKLDAADNRFMVKDKATGDTVFVGDIKDETVCNDCVEHIFYGDFTELKTPGTYTVMTIGGAESYEFTIGEDVYNEPLNAITKMLYYQRCGMELTSEYAGDFAHPACHKEEGTVFGTDKKLDVSGGWHDAGDYGKYVVAGAKAVADIMLAYEKRPDAFSDASGIPESGNGMADILDEAKYELDWMLKMQDSETGGVYHKVSGELFPETVMPQDETAELIICPISTTATGDFAAVMAMASRVFKDVDATYSATCLDAAKKAYDYLKKNGYDTAGFSNPGNVVTGVYGDSTDKDERFFAMAELYKTTGDASYRDDIKALYDDGKLQVNALGWAGVGGYAAYEYLTTEGADEGLKGQIKEEYMKAIDENIESSGKSGYLCAVTTKYPWGSNMTVANAGMMFLFADEIEADEKYGKLAQAQLDYLLGVNGTGYCFVTGMGTQYPENPHHRPSQVIGKAVPGMLVGGPNSALEDPYAKAVLANKPSALCYADNNQSYSCNEITIYWNSPLIYLMAMEK